MYEILLTVVVNRPFFIHEQILKHGFKRVSFWMKKDFWKQNHRVIEFLLVEKPIMSCMIIFITTRLFKSSKKDFETKFICNHASFDHKGNELSDVHGTVFITFRLKQLSKPNFFSLFKVNAVLCHFNLFWFILIYFFIFD